jgi:hypothetical protein
VPATNTQGAAMEENDVNVPLAKRASSRRFILAMIFTVGGTFGLFYDKVESEHYYWLAAGVLMGYAGTEWAKGKPPVKPS